MRWLSHPVDQQADDEFVDLIVRSSKLATGGGALTPLECNLDLDWAMARFDRDRHELNGALERVRFLERR